MIDNKFKGWDAFKQKKKQSTNNNKLPCHMWIDLNTNHEKSVTYDQWISEGNGMKKMSFECVFILKFFLSKFNTRPQLIRVTIIWWWDVKNEQNEWVDWLIDWF